MKKYHYFIFILFVFSLATFIFYALWHTASIKHVNNSIIHRDKNHSFIPENDTPPPTIDENDTEDNIESLQTIIEDTNVSLETHEQMLAHTQKIYNELIPDDYNETIEEVNLAFQRLEEYTKELDVEIQNQEDEIDSFHQDISNLPVEERNQEVEEIDIEVLKGELEDEQ